MSVNPFLNRLLANKEINYDEEGRLMIMHTPAYVFSLNLLVLMQSALKEEFGEKGHSVYQAMLGMQSRMGARIMRNRFGFDKERGIQEQLGQAQMVGAGKLELVRADYKNDEYILRCQSNFAKEFAKTFGPQKKPVDILLRGGLAGMFLEHTGKKDIVCIETQCIASGASYCEFVVKEKKKFNLKDVMVKEQLPPSLKFNFDKYLNALGVPVRK